MVWLLIRTIMIVYEEVVDKWVWAFRPLMSKKNGFGLSFILDMALLFHCVKISEFI